MGSFRQIVAIIFIVSTFANLCCLASIIDTLVGSSKSNISSKQSANISSSEHDVDDDATTCVELPSTFVNKTFSTSFERFLSKHALTVADNKSWSELAELLHVSAHDAQNILQANWTFIRQRYLADADGCARPVGTAVAKRKAESGPVCQFNETTLLNLTAQFGEQTPRMLRFLCLNTPESYLISYSFAWKYVRVCLLITLFVFALAVLKILFRTSGLVNYVPDSCLLILLGFVAGFVLKGHADTVFFLVLLPPIILESAYQMYDREFVKWFAIVMLFAVAATLLNTVIVGPLLYGLNQWGLMGSVRLELSFLCCMTYASIISATDPVAVLALFSDLGVNSALYFLVFGEALFNDGIAAVLFNTFHVLMFEQHQITAVHVIVALAKVFLTSFGAVVIGIVCGILTSLLVKFTEHCRVVEPLLFFVLAYVAYLVSNLMYFSGIIGIIVCGVTQWHYAARNVSIKSRTTVKYFSRTLASLADSAVFVGFGLLIIEEFTWHTGFVCWTLALIFVARFGIIFGLSAVANSRAVWPISPRKITYGEQFITAYGGLRGALAFGLAVQLNPRILGGYTYYRAKQFGFDTNYELLVSTTMVVVLFTVFVQGMTLKPIIFKFLNVSQIFATTTSDAKSTDENASPTNEIVISDDLTASSPDVYKKSKLLKRLQHVDRRFVKPWLLKRNCCPPISHDLAEVTRQASRPDIVDETAEIASPTAAGSRSVSWRVGTGAINHTMSISSMRSNDQTLAQSASQHYLKPKLSRMFSVLRDDVADDTEDEATYAEHRDEHVVLRHRRRPLHSYFASHISLHAIPSHNLSHNNDSNGTTMELSPPQPSNVRKISQMTVVSNSSTGSHTRSRHQQLAADAADAAVSNDEQQQQISQADNTLSASDRDDHTYSNDPERSVRFYTEQ